MAKIRHFVLLQAYLTYWNRLGENLANEYTFDGVKKKKKKKKKKVQWFKVRSKTD